jgi:thioredoxin-related protein
MQRRILTLLAAAAFSLASHTALSAQSLLGGTVSSPTSGKEWHSITDGLKLAAKEKKPLIVDFYTDWCGWCKVMDQKTYGDNRIKTITTKSFILAKYNPEKDSAFEFQGKKVKPTEFAKIMAVNGYPTTAFFSADGKYLESMGGYIEANKFLDILNYMVNRKYDGIGGRTIDEHLMLENIDRDPNNAKFRIDLAQYYSDSVNYKKSLEIFQYVVDMKPSDPEDLFALYNGLGSTQYFHVKDYKTALVNFRKALTHPSQAQTKARTMLWIAMAEAQDNQPKQATESLQKFAKYCKDQKIPTQGLRSTLEQSSALASLRDSKDFQQVVKQLQ